MLAGLKLCSISIYIFFFLTFDVFWSGTWTDQGDLWCNRWNLPSCTPCLKTAALPSVILPGRNFSFLSDHSSLLVLCFINSVEDGDCSNTMFHGSLPHTYSCNPMSFWGCNFENPWLILPWGWGFHVFWSQCIFDPAVSRLVDSYLRREVNGSYRQGLDSLDGNWTAREKGIMSELTDKTFKFLPLYRCRLSHVLQD